MARVPDITPYQGHLQMQSRAWYLSVAPWPGARRIALLEAQDVFDVEVLRAHLVLADLEPEHVTLQGLACYVTTRHGQRRKDWQAATLLRILKRYYSHYKGRPIDWRQI